MGPNFERAGAAATGLLLEQRLRSLQIDVTRLRYRQIIYFDTMQHFCAVTQTNLARLTCGSDCLRDGCTLIRRRQGRAFYIVLYNRDKNPRRQCFTLAHEVGHIVLGHLEDGDIQEQEANCFAAQLLAPRVLVRALAEVAGRPLLPEDLQEVFSLSREAAANRLRELRWCCSSAFSPDELALLHKCRHLLHPAGEPVVSF